MPLALSVTVSSLVYMADICRRRSVNALVNSATAFVLRPSAQLTWRKRLRLRLLSCCKTVSTGANLPRWKVAHWSTLQPGDLILLQDGDCCPADCIVLAAAPSVGSAHVEVTAAMAARDLNAEAASHATSDMPASAARFVALGNDSGCQAHASECVTVDASQLEGTFSLRGAAVCYTMTKPLTFIFHWVLEHVQVKRACEHAGRWRKRSVQRAKRVTGFIFAHACLVMHLVKARMQMLPAPVSWKVQTAPTLPALMQA